ncbi:MAG: prepilin peptidase [Zetaproteobacteria bacterium CG12_big_fil_rev_8_21_14_0_65_55_1124]|nr:MAG: prepilin peptidase [Zetaproteobacteria bacterium CG1_02_55_237]PIS18839.1 MAG: prepilin peptidase [Zetaproteobacteria bacterium CG08_land_8_20_14_0_20_55_17]PIW42758.1 MAG: prepilin peptidase [Zetaproteobacteria bacterium CG12_big_fil_rev_8_21_14_0_65_55_1124]PIY51784.1 MAG: prepilin peptidase [Zetaproteobacteria bacterium CG_4_10_14_0_8_um_filter_55_43]PIZ40036.1 MAG: prepilin peptidase [Zetaproteobacteria bacterium CG_4_10_14_0_2_um_filter_55_20]PJB82743.1 MAG: prepilin peptidase [Ze
MFVIGSCGLLGLLFGSFANVLVHRLPRGESIAFPGSHCPKCEHAIAWYDNIPVLSWMVLRGRCRHCAAPVAVRYPLLEAGLGLIWGLLAWHFSLKPELGMALVLSFLLWVLTWIDLETGLLPNALTFPGIALGLLYAVFFGDIYASLAGALAGYGVFWLVARVFLLLTGREGMGQGDFKLLAMLGAFLGWQALPFVIFLSSFVGAVIGSVYLLLTRNSMRAEIPFGPYLAVAGMIWLVWGEGLLFWFTELSRGLVR